MKQQQREGGVAHLGIVLAVVLVVAAVAFGGWWVWEKNKGAEQTSNPNAKSSNQQEQKQSDPTEGGKYLVIEEWGVRMLLGENIRGAYYVLNSDNLGQYVTLYDSEFDSLKNANGLSCGGEDKFMFYAITRATPENADALKNGPVSSDFPEFKKYPFTNEFLFNGLGASQAPPACSNLNPDPNGTVLDDENIFNIANEKERAFDSAYNMLEAAN